MGEWEQTLALVAWQLPWMAPVVGAIFGSVAGSFLNCARYRVPRGMSLWSPPSSCTTCRRILTTPDLIPILSWLALRGCCRTCDAPIGITSLLIELVSLLVGAALAYVIGLHLWLIPALLLGLALYCVLAILLLRRWC